MDIKEKLIKSFKNGKLQYYKSGYRDRASSVIDDKTSIMLDSPYPGNKKDFFNMVLFYDGYGIHTAVLTLKEGEELINIAREKDEDFIKQKTKESEFEKMKALDEERKLKLTEEVLRNII